MYNAKILTDKVINQSENIASSSIKYLESYSYHCVVSDLLVATGANNKTFQSSTAEVSTATFPALIALDDGDYIVVYDHTDQPWAIAADKTGSSEEPTGALWASIDSANKAQVDLSLTTDAASVAAAFELAFDALTDFSTVIATDDSAADGTMLFTNQTVGAAIDAVTKSEDDADAGTIEVDETIAGTDSVLHLTAETIAIPDHGFYTGTKVAATTAGTLPTGLSATNYYVIRVDASTIKLATNLVNANAGTAVNITAEGTGVHTLTPAAISGASIKIQGSNNNVDFADLANTSVNITSTGSGLVDVTSHGHKYTRAVFTVTAGQFVVNLWLAGTE